MDYALSNAHLSLAEIANHLGVGYSTIDKWIRQPASNKTSRRVLTAEQKVIIALKKEVKKLKMANDILKKLMCTSSTIQVDEVPLHEKPFSTLFDDTSLPVTQCESVRLLCLVKKTGSISSALRVYQKAVLET